MEIWGEIIPKPSEKHWFFGKKGEAPPFETFIYVGFGSNFQDKLRPIIEKEAKTNFWKRLKVRIFFEPNAESQNLDRKGEGIP